MPWNPPNQQPVNKWQAYSLSIGPQKYTTDEFVLTSLVVSRMPGLSNFDSFYDEW